MTENKKLVRQNKIAQSISGEITALDAAAHELRSRKDEQRGLEWLRDVVAEIDNKEDALDTAIAACKALDIASPIDYASAADWIVVAKEREIEFKDMRERFVGPAYRLHKHLTGVFRPLMEKASEGIAILNRKMNAWDTEQQRIVREREAELQAMADQEAAEERQKAEVEALKVESADPDLAEEIRDEAASQPVLRPIVAPHAPPKTEGLTQAKLWKAEIDDPEAFVAGVLSGAIPSEYAKILPNLEVLRGIAKATNGKKQVPGITFRQETTRRRK